MKYEKHINLYNVDNFLISNLKKKSQLKSKQSIEQAYFFSIIKKGTPHKIYTDLTYL